MNLTDQNDWIYATERLPKGVKIVKDTPAPFRKGRPHFNFTEFLLSNGNKFWISHVKPVYYIDRKENVRPLGEVLSYHGNRKMVLKEGWENKIDFAYLCWLVKRQALLRSGLMMPMSRVPLLLNAFGGPYYPDPDPESTSCDGSLENGASGESWATVRGGSSTTHTGESVLTSFNIQVAEFGAPNIRLRNGVTLFDSSAIPDTDTISAGTVSYKPSSLGGTTDATTTNVVEFSPASNTDIVANDFGTRVLVNLGSILDSALVVDTYADITLNATGLTKISKTGITKLGGTQGLDISNTAPTGNNGAAYYSADTAGTTSDPKLSGTSAGVSAAANLMLLGVQ